MAGAKVCGSWTNFTEPLRCFSDGPCPDLAAPPGHFSSTPPPSNLLVLQFSSLDHLERNTFKGTQIKRLLQKRGWDFSTRFPLIILVHSHHSHGVGGKHDNSHFLLKETEAQGPGTPTAEMEKDPPRETGTAGRRVIWSGGLLPSFPPSHHSTHHSQHVLSICIILLGPLAS